MANYTRNSLSGVLAPVNAELEKVQEAIEAQVDRSPVEGEPNQMSSSLDMNGNSILNLPTPVNPNDPLRLKDVSESFLDVNIFTDETVEVQTFAEAQNLSPAVGQRIVVRERGNASYITQTEGTSVWDGDVEFANGLSGRLQIIDTVKCVWFGVHKDNDDNYSEITSAIARAVTQGLADIELPEGTLLVSDEITLGTVGLTLRGQGAGSYQDGISGRKTELKGTNETKAVIRIKLESCKVQNLLVNSDSTRQAASRNFTQSNYNCGIRVEAEDVPAPEGDVFDTQITDVHVTNQPNDGILMVGRIYGSSHHTVICSNNGGHGLAVTNGELSNRTNTAVAGVLSLTDCSWDDNEGHGVRCGRRNSTDYTLRVIVSNCEGLYNGGDVSLLSELADSFYHCDSLTIINGAATGTDKARVDNALAGYALMGTGGTLLDARILATSVPVLLCCDGVRRTESWNFISPHIRTTDADHVVFLESGVQDIYVSYGDNTDSGVTKATNITGGIVGLTTYFRGEYFTTCDSTWANDVEFNGAIRVDGTGTINSEVTVTSGGALSFNNGATFTDGNNLSLMSTKLNNQSIDGTATVILDASEVGTMWEINGRNTGDPCLSSFTCTVVGGSTPVVSGLVNQSGAAVNYVLAVNGTDIELTVDSLSRATDIFIKEVAVA